VKGERGKVKRYFTVLYMIQVLGEDDELKGKKVIEEERKIIYNRSEDSIITGPRTLSLYLFHLPSLIFYLQSPFFPFH